LRFGALAIGTASIAVLGGCGSSAGPAPHTGPVAACQLVSAVLSDGPDPAQDPVGYAEAQFGPLRQLHTSDRSLQAAVDRLSSAYETFFHDGGSATGRKTVSEAAGSVNALCPGAGAGQ
jgi:hypothetical protein